MPRSNGSGTQAQVLDFSTCSKAAFDQAVVDFTVEREQLKQAGTLPANPFPADGWYDITPQMAHDALMLTPGNREFGFQSIKAYAADMAAGTWAPTAQAIGFTGNELDDGHHRFAAAFLGGYTFKSFVIVSTPPVENRFAFYDVGKKRNIADSLHIAGWNGTGKIMAMVIADLAVRYEMGQLGVAKQPRFKRPNPRQALRFMEAHPDLRDASRHILANYSDAIAIVQSRPAAVFFGYLIIKHYGEAALDDFFRSLATGANLAEDSVMLALRNRLQAPEAAGQTTPARGRLALLIKGYRAIQAGEVMPRNRGRVLPMTFPDPGQPFPRIEPNVNP